MLMHEFDGTRGEVIREVERAPDRATDNVLNLLKTTASRLKVGWWSLYYNNKTHSRFLVC